MPSTALDSSTGSLLYYGASMLSSVFQPIIAFFPGLLFLSFVAFVVYYFTGANKKGDAIVKNLMLVGIKVLQHVWLFVSAFTVFIGLYTALHYIAYELLPKESSRFSRATLNTVDSKAFVQGIAIALLGVLVFAAVKWIDKKVLTTSELKPTVVRKFYIILSLMTYATIWFVATLTVILSVIDYAYDDSETISPSAIALMLASLIMLGMYKMKSFKVLKVERGE